MNSKQPIFSTDFDDDLTFGLHGNAKNLSDEQIEDFDDYEEEVVEEYKRLHPQAFDQDDYDYENF